MIAKLSSPIYLRYELKSAHEKPIAFKVSTVEGLNEAAELVKKRTGFIHLICEEEFLKCDCAERVTDDCTKVGAVYAPDSVFFIFVA